MSAGRLYIYQLMVRTFGNKVKTRVAGGTIGENGCGKFSDIDGKALGSIREMGFNCVWLTGVLEHASGTGYEGRPADPPDILKGVAGSPYAVRDYFDVCPDYADEAGRRLEEFKDLLGRCRAEGLRVLMDFVPNHVARSYGSDVRPDLSFGDGDRTDVFFDRENHFFYLDDSCEGGGPPLKLPTQGRKGCTGLFGPETGYGRVTGNNAATWSPSVNDWYETVKLNYGHDFRRGRDTEHLPGVDACLEVVPKTWRTMDEIIGYWQEMGVDGFRVDMAHMVPMEFWRWLVRRSRERDADVVFIAEAYDGDPAKLTDGDVIEELWEAGFDAAYQHPTYQILQGIYEYGKWANDLDGEVYAGYSFHHCVRYLENHDEVRIANPRHWGGHGMNVGKAAAGVMFGMSRAMLMIYNGQEVGEPALGAEGFSGDDGRTSIFDYTAMPEFQKWVNGGEYDGGGLSDGQKELREWYAKLLEILRQPAFENGGFYGLNFFNRENERYGRMGGEGVSGHWLYSYLRCDQSSGQVFLCAVNLHPSERMRGVRIVIPAGAFEFMGWKDEGRIELLGRVGCKEEIRANMSDVLEKGLEIGDLEAFEVIYYELKRTR